MTDRLDWFPCYPGRLLGALGGMKPAEGYVYVVVLLRIYECGGCCPDSLETIATRCRMNKRLVADALDPLFRAGRLVRTSDGIRNPKADDVLATSNAIRAKRKQAGQKGGSRAAEKTKPNQQKPADFADPLLQQKGTPLQLDLEGKSQNPPPTQRIPSEANASARAERERYLFKRGKAVLGYNAGGMISTLLKAESYDVEKAIATIELAAQKSDAREWVAGAIRQRNNNGGINGRGSSTAAARELVEGLRSGAVTVPPEPRSPHLLRGEGGPPVRQLPPR